MDKTQETKEFTSVPELSDLPFSDLFGLFEYRSLEEFQDMYEMLKDLDGFWDWDPEEYTETLKKLVPSFPLYRARTVLTYLQNQMDARPGQWELKSDCLADYLEYLCLTAESGKDILDSRYCAPDNLADAWKKAFTASLTWSVPSA